MSSLHRRPALHSELPLPDQQLRVQSLWLCRGLCHGDGKTLLRVLANVGPGRSLGVLVRGHIRRVLC
jgi:hypothetical protein